MATARARGAALSTMPTSPAHTRRSSCAAATLALFLFGACQGAPESASTKPRNVILMMADDLASNDLSCYGGRNIQTPHLDAFAAESLRLTDYYAGSAVCTPSRMALLSGAYPARLGWRWGVLGYGFPSKTGMSGAVYTMAEAFRDAGYRTAMAGKWHLGDGSMSPKSQGFASSLYIRMSNNQNRDMFRDGGLVQKDWDNRTLTAAFAEEALRVVEADRDEPFFLYLPWSAPHFPAEPHPEWAGRSGGTRAAKYKDVVEELDHRVGALLAALERAGKADDTIVIFTSDNGRQPGQESKHPDPLFRGKKWQSLEGGARVPCLVRCPGEVQPGVSDQLVSAMDLFPTLAAACGVAVQLPDDAQALDGLDLWPNLTRRGRTPTAVRTELLYWHGKGAAAALRVGPWKLRFHADGQKPADPPLEGGPELFDLVRDPQELQDLAARDPARAAAMRARARLLLEEIYSAQVPLGVQPGAKPAPAPLTAPAVWGPWLGVSGR